MTFILGRQFLYFYVSIVVILFLHALFDLRAFFRQPLFLASANFDFYDIMRLPTCCIVRVLLLSFLHHVEYFIHDPLLFSTSSSFNLNVHMAWIAYFILSNLPLTYIVFSLVS